MIFKTIINYPAYHLFKYKKEFFLYDVSTKSLSEINSFACDFLKNSGKYDWENLCRVMQAKYPDFTKKDGLEIIDTLKKQGFFKYKKIDKLEQEKLIQNLWSHHPNRIQLFLSQKCNLKCIYCYGENNQSNTKNRLMSFETAKTAIEYFIKKSGNRKELQVTYFGGEPLLNYKVLKDITEYCKSIENKYNKKFTFELITNGTLLTKPICDYLIENDFLLFVSLDGWREMNNYQRPAKDGKDYFDTILKNAKYLVENYRKNKSKKRIKVRANLTDKFYDLKKTVKFLENEGFDMIGIAGIQNLVYCDETAGALNEKQERELTKQSQTLLKEALKIIEKKQRLTPYIKRMLNKNQSGLNDSHNLLGIRCGICRNTSAVDVDGNIFPCHRYVGLEKYITGNIYDGMDYDKTVGLYRKYNETALEYCADCWMRDICGGPCPWEVSSPDGKIWKQNKKWCKKVEKGFEFSLWLKYKLETIKTGDNI